MDLTEENNGSDGFELTKLCAERTGRYHTPANDLFGLSATGMARSYYHTRRTPSRSISPPRRTRRGSTPPLDSRSTTTRGAARNLPAKSGTETRDIGRTARPKHKPVSPTASEKAAAAEKAAEKAAEEARAKKAEDRKVQRFKRLGQKKAEERARKAARPAERKAQVEAMIARKFSGGRTVVEVPAISSATPESDEEPPVAEKSAAKGATTKAPATKASAGRKLGQQDTSDDERPKRKAAPAKATNGAKAAVSSKVQEPKPKTRAGTIPKAAPKPQENTAKAIAAVTAAEVKPKSASKRVAQEDIDAELVEEFKDRDAALEFRTQIDNIADRMLDDAFATALKHLRAASKELKKVEDEAQKKSDEKISGNVSGEEVHSLRRSARCKRVLQDSDDDKSPSPSPKKKVKTPERKG